MKFFNLVSAFLYKELKVAQHFKFLTLTKFLYFLFQIIIFYFISGIISKNYFSFIFLGLIFSRTFHGIVSSFVETLKQEQYLGTTYILFSSFNELMTIFASVIVKFLFLIIELLVMIFISNIFFNINFTLSHVILIILFSLFSITCLLWYPIFLLSFSLLINKVENIFLFLTPLIDILSGVYFMPTLLPLPLRYVSKFLPTTYILSLLRETILNNKFVFTYLFYPTMLGVVLLPLSIITFNYVLRKALKTGKLTSY